MSDKPTLTEQIEACDIAANIAQDVPDIRARNISVNALRAAYATLRRVQECRDLADQQIADGVIVAAEIEGLVP